MKLHLPLSLSVYVCGVLSSAAAVGNTGSVWDSNWGAAGLVGAPDASAAQYQADITASGVTALVQPAGAAAPYDFATYTAITLTGAGNTGAQIFGGAASTDSTATGSVVRDTWIAAEAGQYNMLVGGNFADNWNGGAAFNFTGNTHILVNGASVANIVGGNYKDGQAASFTGNSYISVVSGNVSGSIVGAGVVTHNRNAQFSGDTNVFVYVPLSDNSGPAINLLPQNMVAGGYGWATNTWKTQTITGDTHVTVDLRDYTGAAADFAKHVVGGGFCGAGGNAMVIEGDTYVSLNLGEQAMAAGVRVLGGHWVNAGSGSVSGTAHLSIGSGAFNDWVVGASWTDVANTTTSYGGVDMQLSGGSFAGNVIGATRLAPGVGNAAVGAVQVDISGADLSGTLYGGHYINGTGTDTVSAQVGDIDIVLTGGSVGDIVGGSYVVRNNAAAVVQQGDITINLQGGAVNGNIYAAGQQGGSTALQTASTTVTVGAGVTFSDSSLVSGDYVGNNITATVMGARSLVFGDAATYDNVADVVFDSFDTVEVAEGGYVTVKGFTRMPHLQKTGGGALAFTADAALTDISLQGGSLIVHTSDGATTLQGNVTAVIGTQFVIDGPEPLVVQGAFSAPDVRISPNASLVLNGSNNVLSRILGGGSFTLGESAQAIFRFNTDTDEQVVNLDSWRIENGAALTLYSEGSSPLGTGGYLLGELAEWEAVNYTLTLSGAPFMKIDTARSFLEHDDGRLWLILVERGTNPMADVADSHNARAGAELLWNAPAPTPGGDIRAAYDEVMLLLREDNPTGANELMAAVAGSSYAALGVAFEQELRQRLYAIRNRTTQMGLSPCYVYDDIPLWNAWVNADGSYSEMRADGTAAGYKLSSWGGTVGVDIAFDESWCGGFAFTALYGDFDAMAPDALSGDFDTYTLALFTKYENRAWSHTFLAAGSWLETSLHRRVQAGALSYSTEGDTHGFGLGLMYELGYKISFNQQQTCYLQPIAHVVYTHSNVCEFSETGADAALSLGNQSLNSLVFGLGLRAQTTIGESEDNRFGTLQGHALLKIHVLDRNAESDVAFAAGGASASVISARGGVLGAEIGAGLNIPVGVGSGVLFIDAAAEFRADAVDVFGTVGYRFRF